MGVWKRAVLGDMVCYVLRYLRARLGDELCGNVRQIVTVELHAQMAAS